jgi:hypothetical protein
MATTKDRLGFVPYSVLDYVSVPDLRKREAELKRWVADRGQARKGALVTKSNIWGSYTSIFSPMLADTILHLWGPGDGASVLDPFGGGGTRAFMACRAGLRYEGIELRPAEIRRVERRATELGLSPILHRGDAGKILFSMVPESFDFCYTCPPYYNLERYHGGRADLSMAGDYGTFCGRLRRVLVGTFRALRPGSRAVWVVGNFRTGQGANRMRDFRGDLIRLAEGAGFELDELAVVRRPLGSAPRRVGMSLRRRRLVRIHEYAVVLIKP